MTRREFDMAHCKQAWDLRNKKIKGKRLSFKQIGEMLGVSERRASMMYDTYQFHVLEEEAKADLAAWRHSLYEVAK